MITSIITLCELFLPSCRFNVNAQVNMLLYLLLILGRAVIKVLHFNSLELSFSSSAALSKLRSSFVGMIYASLELFAADRK